MKIVIPNRTVSVRELAVLCNVNKQTVYRWERLGTIVDGRIVRLKIYRVGGSKRIEPEAVEKFLEELNPEAPTKKLTPAKESKLVQDAAAEARAWLHS